MTPAPTARAMRERTPSAPTTSRACSVRASPSRSRTVTPVTRPVASVTVPVTETPVCTDAPASSAAVEQDGVEDVAARREQVVDAGLVLDLPDEVDRSGRWNDTDRMGGAPLATTSSSRPQRASWTTPPRAMAWVDSVSLGSSARSTTTTSRPWRASSIAVAAPAQRAPTTTTSRRFGTGGSDPCRHHRGSAPSTFGEDVESFWRVRGVRPSPASRQVAVTRSGRAVRARGGRASPAGSGASTSRAGSARTAATAAPGSIPTPVSPATSPASRAPRPPGVGAAAAIIEAPRYTAPTSAKLTPPSRAATDAASAQM